MPSSQDERMDEQQPSQAQPSNPQDLATAYRELTKGEQTATQLENNLTSLESRLDAMLAAFERQQQQQPPQQQRGGQGSSAKEEGANANKGA